MNKSKVITSYVRYADADLDVLAGGTVKSLTGNANFTFTGTELTALTAAETAYHSKLILVATGGPAAIIEKNTARADLLTAMNVMAIQVNLQANGDLLKLQSSGLPLVKQPQYHSQPIPTGLVIDNGTNGDLKVKVDSSPVGDNGVVFAYTPATNTITDPNQWTLKPVNSHSIVLKALTPSVGYKVTAAYKGNDIDELVWAPPTTKFASN